MDFMDGIIFIEEIKSHTVIALLIGLIIVIIGFSIFIVAISALLSTMLFGEVREKIANIVLIVIAIFITVVGGVFAMDITSFEKIKNKFDLIKPTGQYKVSINCNIDMNEFYKKYEIISCENGVYVIKKKGE